MGPLGLDTASGAGAAGLAGCAAGDLAGVGAGSAGFSGWSDASDWVFSGELAFWAAGASSVLSVLCVPLTVGAGVEAAAGAASGALVILDSICFATLLADCSISDLSDELVRPAEVLDVD